MSSSREDRAKPIFEMRGLHYQVAARTLISVPQLRLDAACLTLVLGPNGAGKTTLLRCLAGLLSAEGSIALRGRELSSYSLRERAQLVAWVPSQLPLSFDLSVAELVQLGRYPWHEGYPQKSDRKKVSLSLEQLGIGQLHARLVSTLSSGEWQKVQIARALACDVACMILDEPCAHLDVGARFEMMGILEELAAAGRSVIMSTHDLYVTPRFASRYLLVKSGGVLGYQATAPGTELLQELYGHAAALS